MDSEDEVVAILTLKFSQKAFDKMREIKKLSESEDHIQDIKNALALYSWYLQLRKNGDMLMIKDKNGHLFLTELSFEF